jgi:polyphosphate kinase
VRGICCLKPGVENLSSNIKVKSIIGKYLEHSRIYKFGQGDDVKVYIGSADLMHRNISRRCETLIPIENPRHRARLDEIIRICLYDEDLTWVLQDDKWEKVEGDEARNAHTLFEGLHEKEVTTKTPQKKKLLFYDD